MTVFSVVGQFKLTHYRFLLPVPCAAVIVLRLGNVEATSTLPKISCFKDAKRMKS